MTRTDFINEAKKLNYADDDIKAILADVDALTADAPDCFEFDYSHLPLFEQPTGDI